jgi:hypothetical protein
MLEWKSESRQHAIIITKIHRGGAGGQPVAVLEIPIAGGRRVNRRRVVPVAFAIHLFGAPALYIMCHAKIRIAPMQFQRRSDCMVSDSTDDSRVYRSGIKDEVRNRGAGVLASMVFLSHVDAECAAARTSFAGRLGRA